MLMVALGCAVRAVAADTDPPAQPSRVVRAIDWRTSPLDLDLRGLNGERFRFRCPPGKPMPDLLAGDRIYTDSSPICTAAVHAGTLRPGEGGLVSIEILPGRLAYRGASRHFVTSRAFDGAWGGSFVVRPIGGPAAAGTVPAAGAPR